MSEDRWLDRPGARLRWRDTGSGPALLLLHGWALDLSLFDLVVDALRGRLRLLRFDRRGYGLSTGEPSLPADVTDGFAVLDAAGVARCAVLGMSQGARVAAGMARQSPDRIERVILDGAPALRGLADEEHEPELPLQHFRALAGSRSGPRGEVDSRTRPAESALVAALQAHPLLRLVHADETRSALLRTMLERYPAHDLTTERPPAPPPTFQGGKAAFPQPVLIVNGACDSAARLRIGRRLAAVLPAARRIVLEHAAHLACLDDPAAYAAAVREFLGS